LGTARSTDSQISLRISGMLREIAGTPTGIAMRRNGTGMLSGCNEKANHRDDDTMTGPASRGKMDAAEVVETPRRPRAIAAAMRSALSRVMGSDEVRLYECCV